MPLDDLTGLGYEINDLPQQTVVRGHGREFFLNPGDDEQALIDRASNHAVLYAKLEQAQDYFADNYSGWGTLTAQQKDVANRNAQRALANLIRYVRNDLSSEGV